MKHHGATRRALVTGGNSGIGRALLKELSARGWEIEFCGRNEETLEAAAREFPNGFARRCDLRNPLELLAYLQDVAQRGPLDLVVNNAGLYNPSPLDSQTPQAVDDLVSTNLIAPIRVVQECLKRHLLLPGSTVITISSVAADTAFDGSAVYGATKAGLSQAMRVARQELRSKGIRFCNIHPGATRTPAWGDLADDLSNKLMSPESVAQVVLAACLDHPDVVVEEMILRPPTGDL